MTSYEKTQLRQTGISTIIPHYRPWNHRISGDLAYAKEKWKCCNCDKTLAYNEEYARIHTSDEEGQHRLYYCMACLKEMEGDDFISTLKH